MDNINTILTRIVTYQMRIKSGAKSKTYTAGLKDATIKVINIQSFTI